MLPDLPKDYYLDNVVTLFEHVERLYADILPRQHCDFLQIFAGLPIDAKKLYVRLLNRSHDLFRQGKLNYPEIESIPKSLTQLESFGLIIISPEVETVELIRLFSKAELLATQAKSAELRKFKRDELETYLLSQADSNWLSQLQLGETLLQVLCKDSYLICQMLFFGNLNQSMTDFVLRGLGISQYEKYTIDPSNRPYTCEFDIQQHWLLHKIYCLMKTAEPDDIDTLQICFDSLPTDLARDSALFRNTERIKIDIARQFERLGHLSLALQHYRQCYLPPSRERSARILNSQGHVEASLALCDAIIQRSLGDEELQFGYNFGARLIKQLNKQPAQIKPMDSVLDRYPVFKKKQYQHKPNLIELELPQQKGVEQAVADYYQRQNPNNLCYFAENSLFTGVLGLLIWDVIFAPVSGAFYNPFQHRPSDFYAFDFIQKRTSEFSGIWAAISDNEDILDHVKKYWDQKQGLKNPLVHWSSLNLEIIELALSRIDYQHWLVIFDRILLDLRNNRSGFPDLILFPAQGGYQLIEVKGPGDTLQKNQQRWMQFFFEQNIGHAVARVSWHADE